MFNIEEWCKEFKQLPTVPMTDELTRIMLSVMMGQVNREAIEDVFMYKIVKARSEAIGLEISQDLIDFFALLCQSPGDATMYLSLLRQEQANGREATMGGFIEIFPWGFPTQEVLGELWDKQKVKDAPLGNALDLNWWREV